MLADRLPLAWSLNVIVFSCSAALSMVSNPFFSTFQR